MIAFFVGLRYTIRARERNEDGNRQEEGKRMQTTQKRREAKHGAQALLDQMTIEEKAGQLAAFFPQWK